MKILVTGSSGIVGSKIVEAVSKHRTCVGVDLVPGEFTTHLASITDKEVINKIVSGMDAVIRFRRLRSQTSVREGAWVKQLSFTRRPHR